MEVLGIATVVRGVAIVGEPYSREQRLACLDEQREQLCQKKRVAGARDPEREYGERIRALECVLERLVGERRDYVRVCCDKREVARRALEEADSARAEYAELVKRFDDVSLGCSYLCSLWFLSHPHTSPALAPSPPVDAATRLGGSLLNTRAAARRGNADAVVADWHRRFELIKTEVERDQHPQPEQFTLALEDNVEERRTALQRFVVDYTAAVGRSMPGVDCSLLELEPLLALDKTLYDEIREFSCLAAAERQQALEELSALRCAYGEKLARYRVVVAAEQELEREDAEHLRELSERIEASQCEINRLRRLRPMEVATCDSARAGCDRDLTAAEEALRLELAAAAGADPCTTLTAAWRTYHVYECETFEINFQLCPPEGEQLDLCCALKRDNTVQIESLEREKQKLQLKIASFNEALRCGLRRHEIVRRMAQCKTHEEMKRIEQELEQEASEDTVLEAILRCERRVKEICAWQEVLYSQQERGVCADRPEPAFRFEDLKAEHSGKYMIDIADRASQSRFLCCFNLVVKPRHALLRAQKIEARAGAPGQPATGIPFHLAVERLALDMDYACRSVPYYVLCKRMRDLVDDEPVQRLGEHLCDKYERFVALVCDKACLTRPEEERKQISQHVRASLHGVTLQEFKDSVRPEILTTNVWSPGEQEMIRALDKDTRQSNVPSSPAAAPSPLGGLSAEMEDLEPKVSPAASDEVDGGGMTLRTKQSLRMMHSKARMAQTGNPCGGGGGCDELVVVAELLVEKESAKQEALTRMADIRTAAVAARRRGEREAYGCHPHYAFARLLACRGAGVEEFISNRALLNARSMFDRPRAPRAAKLEEDLARSMRALISEPIYLQDAHGLCGYYGLYSIAYYAPLVTELGRFLADAISIDETLERAACEAVCSDEWDRCDALAESLDLHLEQLRRLAAQKLGPCTPPAPKQRLPEGHGYVERTACTLWFSDARKDAEALAIKCNDWDQSFPSKLYEEKGGDPKRTLEESLRDSRYTAFSDALHDVFCEWHERVFCQLCELDCAGVRAHHRYVWKLLRSEAYTAGADPRRKHELWTALLAVDKNAVRGVLHNLARWMRFAVEVPDGCAVDIDSFEQRKCKTVAEALAGREAALAAAGEPHCKLTFLMADLALRFHRELPVWDVEVAAWRQRMMRWFTKPTPGASPGLRAGAWATDPWKETMLMLDSLHARFSVLNTPAASAQILADRRRLICSFADETTLERHLGGSTLQLARAYCSPLSEKYERTEWFLRLVEDLSALYQRTAAALLAWFDEWAQDALPLRFCFKKDPPRADEAADRLRPELPCMELALESILSTALTYRTYALRRAMQRERVHMLGMRAKGEPTLVPADDSYLSAREEFYRSFSDDGVRSAVKIVWPMQQWIGTQLPREVSEGGSLHDALVYLRERRIWNGTGHERTAVESMVLLWRRLCQAEALGFERLLAGGCAAAVTEAAQRYVRDYAARTNVDALRQSLGASRRSIAEAELAALEYYAQDAWRELPLDRRFAYMPQHLAERLERKHASDIAQRHRNPIYVDPAEALSIEAASADNVNPLPFAENLAAENYVQGVRDTMFFVDDASPEPDANVYPGYENLYVRVFYRALNLSLDHIDWANERDLIARLLTVLRFLHCRDAFAFLYGEEYNLKKLGQVVSSDSGGDSTALWRCMFMALARLSTLHVNTVEWSADYVQIKNRLVALPTIADAFKDSKQAKPFAERKAELRQAVVARIADFRQAELTTEQFQIDYIPKQWLQSGLRTAVVEATGTLAVDGRIDPEMAYVIVHRIVQAVDDAARNNKRIKRPTFDKALSEFERVLVANAAEPAGEPARREFEMISTELSAARKERAASIPPTSALGSLLRTAAAAASRSSPLEGRIRTLETKRAAMIARYPELARIDV